MPDIPVLYGQDMVGTLAKLPLRTRPSCDGIPYWATDQRRLFMPANHIHRGLFLPADGGLVYSASSPRIIADDFKFGLNSQWDNTKGTDPQAVTAAVTGDPNGAITLTSGDAGTGIAADGNVLASPLVFAAQDGEIVLYCRMKLNSNANIWFFLGFTDTLPATTLEQPASLATTTYTTTATDACGFLFDTAATTDSVRLVGVANDVDATHIDTSVDPGTSYREYKLVIDTSGNMTAYIDGTAYSQLASAVRPSVNLCAFLGVNARTTTSKIITLDTLIAF